jgi:hemerythrin-like domain-containing protein
MEVGPMQKVSDEFGASELQTKNDSVNVVFFLKLIRENGRFLTWIERMADEAKQLAFAVSALERLGILRMLYEHTTRFEAAFMQACTFEEEILFPIVEKYIGLRGGPISMLAYEHMLTFYLLKQFRLNFERCLPPMDGEIAWMRVQLILQVRDLLRGHFQKDEHILFPIAIEQFSIQETNRVELAYGRHFSSAR